MKNSMSTCIACLLLCVVVVFSLVGCGLKRPVTAGGPVAPAAPVSTLDRLSGSAYEIANALDAGEKEFESLYNSNLPGLSDDRYAKTVAQMFLSAQQCAGLYIGQLKTLATVNESNSAQVADWSNALVSCVNNLVNEGVVGIKSAKARQNIQSILAPIPSAIKLITDAIGIPAAAITSPCQECAAQKIFTEVNLGPNSRSATDHIWTSVSGEPDRIFSATKTGKWSYRPAAPGRRRQDRRRGSDQDAGVFGPAERRIVNPSRQAWLFA